MADSTVSNHATGMTSSAVCASGPVSLPPHDSRGARDNEMAVQQRPGPFLSGFKFPPEIIQRHREELKKRGISPEFAMQSKVRTAADNELRELGFDASLPAEERKKGLQGICFEYRDLAGNTTSYRIKPDLAFSLNG
jgi:hypothetical protein